MLLTHLLYAVVAVAVLVALINVELIVLIRRLNKSEKP